MEFVHPVKILISPSRDRAPMEGTLDSSVVIESESDFLCKQIITFLPISNLIKILFYILNLTSNINSLSQLKKNRNL